jgi:hypothetical protein
MKADGTYLRKRKASRSKARCAQCELIETLRPGASL